jgi:hypothetical protein
METLFQVVNLAVLPFWFAMIVLPTWRVTRSILGSPWVLVPLPTLYVILLAPHLTSLGPLFTNPALGDIARLLGRPEGALIGWVHFLAFDLFVGRWIYLDSRERAINPWLMAPFLLLTLTLGPCGLLGYLGLRDLFTPRPTRLPAFDGPHLPPSRRFGDDPWIQEPRSGN